MLIPHHPFLVILGMVFFHVFPRLPHYLRKPKSMKHPEDSRSDNLRTSAGKKVLLQSHLFGSHPAMVSTTLCQPRAKCRVRGPETVALILCTDDIWWQGCVCHEDQPSGSKCFWLRVWALHGARSKQYILAISCNLVQSLQNGAKSTKFEKKTGKWCSSWLCFSPSLSLSP